MGLDKQAVDVGRSLLVGVALDQLAIRSRPLLVGIGVFTFVAFIGSVLFDDVLRVLCVGLALVALAALVVLLLARFVAGRVLRAIAPPTAVADHRDAIQDAVDQLDLPSGPISGLKFAWGLRNGIDDELTNAGDVISTLKERLDV